MWRVRGVGRVGVGVCGEAEVRVFWDLNRCGCGGAGAEAEEVRIAPNIVNALRSSGLSGPISIQAYGNTRALSHQRFLHSLLATGVDLHHVPGAMKDLSNHLLVDLLLWVKENPPPAHMLLISDDREYSSIMHKLHMRGYNVLLAHPEGDVSPDLLSAANKVWVWDNMMKGTKLAARTCESGALPKMVSPLSSKGVLTKSFNYNESQVSSSQDVQAELDARSDQFSLDSRTKPKRVPKEVVKQVIDVIRLRPNGFTLGAFRRQLGRSNVVLDKDFYGHKDLLSFLLSIPNLKASLVWTSDKTRTYFFTEDSSTHIDSASEVTTCARCDYGRDFSSPKHEMLQGEEGAKSHLGTRIEKVSASQKLNCRSAEKGFSKGSITEKAAGNAAISSGIVADAKNALLISWRLALSKFGFMSKSLQLLGIKATRTEMASSETLLASKGIENNFKDQCVDIAAGTANSQILKEEGKQKTSLMVSSKETPKDDGFTSNSQTLKEEGKRKTSALMVSSKETPKEDGLKVPERAMRDDIKVCIDCTPSECEQQNIEKQGEVPKIIEENGVEKHLSIEKQGEVPKISEENELEKHLPIEKQGEVLKISEENGVEKYFPIGGLKSKLQGQERELQNAVDTVSSFLQAEEYHILKEALEDMGLQHQLSKDIRFNLLKEGRTTTMDDVLQFLMESNLRGVAQLQHEELVELAEIVYGGIVKRIQNRPDCNSGSKAIDNGSLIGALSATFNKFDHESHLGGLGPKLKEEESSKMVWSDKVVLSEEHPKVKEDGWSGRIDPDAADIVLSDLKKLLLDNSRGGVRLAALKPLFKKRYRYELNYKALGHRSLASLISSLENFSLSNSSNGDHLIMYSSLEETHRVDTLISEP